MYNTPVPSRAELPMSRQLLRSTILAAVVATVLLVTTVLPSEYGIDPTGVGRVLGLKKMGEIKVSLAKEAAQDRQAAAAPTPAAAPEQASLAPAPVADMAPAAAPTAVAVAVPVPAKASSNTAAKEVPQNRQVATAPQPATVVAPSAQTHQMTITLGPDQAAEIKLEMRKNAKVKYRWTASGGLINFDAHGDPVNAPKGFYHGYGKGRQVERDEGVLQAAFDGKHGWFWRNRSTSSVTITLNTAGDYLKIKRVL